MTSEKEGKDGIGCNMVFFLVFFFLFLRQFHYVVMINLNF